MSETATITRSRPNPYAATPAPRPPQPHTDPTAAVVAALGTGYDGLKTCSELIQASGLRRGDVVSALAALADAGRVSRQIATLDDGVMVVKWSLRR